MNIHTRTSLGGNRYQITASLSADEAAPAIGETRAIGSMGAVEVESVRTVREHLRFRSDEVLFDIVVRVVEPGGRVSNL